MKQLMAALMFLLLVAPVSAAGSLTISWSTLDTYVRPGGQTTLMLTVANPSTALDASSVKLYLTRGPGLQVSTAYSELGTVGAASSQQTSLVVSAEQGAAAQNSYVTAKVTYFVSGTQYDSTVTIPVKIRRPPSLQLEDASYNGSIEPGSNVRLGFRVVNNGDGPAKDLKVGITQTSGLFTVVGSAEQFVSEIAKGASSQFTYTITIDPDATVGTKLIPITLSYYDETRTDSYSETKSIGLPVSGTADFIVSVDSTENFYFGRQGMVSILIANRGTGSAEYMTVKASSAYGEKETYIGTLDADDTDIIDVPQDLRGAPSSYAINVELDYRDKYNNAFTVNKQVNVSPSTAPVEIPYPTVIIFIIFALVAFWWYKRRRR